MKGTAPSTATYEESHFCPPGSDFVLPRNSRENFEAVQKLQGSVKLDDTLSVVWMNFDEDLLRID
jgi:hypothetical protein